MPGVAFFVCGTPSNNRGFELVELGPGKLPGSPEAYLDKAPVDAAERHRIESLLIDGQRFVQYTRVLKINPNDAEANRGAYVAVGCLIGQRLTLHAVANCLDVVSMLYGRVCSGLTSDRSFPVGYRLADFKSDGTTLEQTVAHLCSPLLVADVVLQALNAEGPIDWPSTREVSLVPEKMSATDVAPYQLYSRQGALGALESIETDRARFQQSTQRATTAAQALLDLQREWSALEGVADRLLTKAHAFQHLTLEMERSVKQDLVLDAASPPRAGGTDRSPLEGAGPELYEREPHGSAIARAGSLRATLGHETAHRRRSAPRQASWWSRVGWSRAVALVVVGGIVAVVAIVAAQRFLPQQAVESAPAQAVVEPEQAVAEPEQQVAEPPPAHPEPDVAKERAALDAPNE